MKFSPRYWQGLGKKSILTILALFLCGLSLGIAAVSLDYFGPPLPGDPSAFTGPFIGFPFADADLALLPPANQTAFEGGATGTELDTTINNAVPEAQLQSTNVPTGGKPSPLFGAQPFEQKMLRFEEFGLEPFDAATNPEPVIPSFPLPTLGTWPEQDANSIYASGPDPYALGSFLTQPGIRPLPDEFANEVEMNPWRLEIEGFLGRPLDTPPADGRPPGRGWAHQRWNELYPQVYFKTALAGARKSHGLRDSKQMHQYSLGEWGPGGLYNNLYRNDVTATSLDGTTYGLWIKFHPNMPRQGSKTIWTFDGSLPPKLLMARYGQGILMRNYNALPIDPSANRGFGLHTISTHEHNGHSPAESDGYTNAFFFPGQFYDYRWPMQLAGYDTINTDASDPRAAFPCAPGETLFVNDSTQSVKTCDANGRIQIRGDYRETMSTHWFHDHMLDYTAQNVYKGNAVMMNYYSAIDRGKEDHNDGVNLRLPSGTALEWGNRDYDINLVIADKAWDTNGQLWFNIFNKDGFVGDQILTNWLYKPYFEVRARRYRFRILNGAVSRYFTLALVRERQDSNGEFSGPNGSGVSYDRVPFYMIANDGNIMEHSVPFDGSVDLNRDGNFQDHNGILPIQSIAERYDIIVDFAAGAILPGDKIYFVNMLEHTNGKVTGNTIPLADILSEAYLPETRDNDGDGIMDEWRRGDPAVGKFFELRVVTYAGTDLSMNPADYLPGGQTMIPLKIDRDDPAAQAMLANVTHRTFEFGRSNGTDGKPWTIKTDGGAGFNMDPRRISAAPQLSTGPTLGGTPDGDGTWEVWSIENGGNGWSHPVHVHFEEGIILRRDGSPPPEWEKWTRKDMYRIGPHSDDGASVEIAIQFREFAGTYMEHCHNTQHEDNAMLLRYDVEHPGQLELMPSPMPSWDGVEYVDSAALPTFRTGDGTGISSAVNGVDLLETPGPNPGEFTYSASALSGVAPYGYRFWLNSPVTGWSIVQGYSNTDSWTFNTNGLASGTYSIQVDARSAGSTAIREAFTVLDHVIADTPPGPVSAFTVTPQRTTYASDGTRGQVDLFVSALSSSILTVSGSGISTTTMTQDSPKSGKFYLHLPLGTTVPADLVIENSLNTQPTPYAMTTVDEVRISTAVYDPATKVLTIKASSGDTMSPPVTLTAPALAVVGNPQANTFDASGTLVIDLSSTIPPLRIQVVSSQGGSSTAKISVVNSSSPLAPIGVNR